jgi:hypothetical protein
VVLKGEAAERCACRAWVRLVVICDSYVGYRNSFQGIYRCFDYFGNRNNRLRTIARRTFFAELPTLSSFVKKPLPTWVGRTFFVAVGAVLIYWGLRSR